MLLLGGGFIPRRQIQVAAIFQLNECIDLSPLRPRPSYTFLCLSFSFPLQALQRPRLGFSAGFSLAFRPPN